jgi:D-alanyl-D-alanine dipeptidase
MHGLNEIILISDHRVLAIPVVDNQERLINLVNQTEIAFGPSPEIPHNTDYTHIRATVYDRLKEAQVLLPQGLFFCVYEGYRSLKLQQYLFVTHYINIQHANPNLKHEQIFKETTKLVSPVINLDSTHNIPPHSTGAAIDIYLIDAQGKPVDMGILVQDWMKDLDGALSCMHSKKISTQAQEYRKIMADALECVGFINYPTEYWHWSYGDRYWAFVGNFEKALYNTV